MRAARPSHAARKREKRDKTIPGIPRERFCSIRGAEVKMHAAGPDNEPHKHNHRER